MNIQYIEKTNLAYCNGLKFRKDRKTGYWLCSTIRKRLHVYIWEHYHGTVPEGYHIHHIDENKDNNDISNLEIIYGKRHQKHHGSLLTDEQREAKRKNLAENARPKASEWHGSKKGKEWHKKHYENVKHLFQSERDFNCEQCGKAFKSTQVNSRFCTNACKSKWRRDSGIDDIERVCGICESPFMVNRFSKTETCSKRCTSVLAYRRRSE